MHFFLKLNNFTVRCTSYNYPYFGAKKKQRKYNLSVAVHDFVSTLPYSRRLSLNLKLTRRGLSYTCIHTHIRTFVVSYYMDKNLDRYTGKTHMEQRVHRNLS